MKEMSKCDIQLLFFNNLFLRSIKINYFKTLCPSTSTSRYILIEVIPFSRSNVYFEMTEKLKRSSHSSPLLQVILPKCEAFRNVSSLQMSNGSCEFHFIFTFCQVMRFCQILTSSIQISWISLISMIQKLERRTFIKICILLGKN